MTSPITRFLGPHRLDSRILVGFLATVSISFGLVMLGSEVAEGDKFAIDQAIMLHLRHSGDLATPIGPHWLVPAMIDFTAMGSAGVLTLITLLAIGYLLARKEIALSAFVAAAIAGGAIVAKLIKFALARPRPEIVPHLVQVSSSSFPSGHSMNSAIVYLTLAILLARSETDRRVQVYLISAAVALALLVGFTRVYLGVHWPSDVLAGWSIGAMWAAGCSLLAKISKQKQKFD